jgi:hypothetical protein
MTFFDSIRGAKPRCARPLFASWDSLALLGALVVLTSACADVDEERPAPRGAAPAGDTEPSQQPPTGAPEEPAPAEEPEPSETCGALSDWLEASSAPTTCDAELAAACSSLEGLWSPSYLAAIGDCVRDGHSPMTCIFLALGELEPTPAHHELATRFCDECAFGVPGCEEIFYFDDDEPIGLGVVALPLSDQVVLEIAEQCTGGLTCSVELPSCARGVIEGHLATAGVLECLLAVAPG